MLEKAKYRSHLITLDPNSKGLPTSWRQITVEIQFDKVHVIEEKSPTTFAIVRGLYYFNRVQFAIER